MAVGYDEGGAYSRGFGLQSRAVNYRHGQWSEIQGLLRVKGERGGEKRVWRDLSGTVTEISNPCTTLSKA